MSETTCNRCEHLARHHWRPEDPPRPTTACLICMAARIPTPCDWTADYVESRALPPGEPRG